MTTDARSQSLGRLDERFDAIVIGGGITGAGLLAELTQLGKKALLVEARDFAWGTSSRSTKLVHGGLRYLRQGQVHVTRESVVERERLMREGGSLVSPLGFNLTAFEGDKLPGWMMGLGLAVYDVIAGRWDHRKLSRDALVRELPALRNAPVVSGYRYLDAQTDDARLTLRVLAEATRRGGLAINYLRAVDLMRTSEGRVRGVVLRDEVSEATHEVEADLVINATGAWADELRGKVGRARKLRLIRGSHLVFGRERAPIHEAVSFFHPRDRRAVFAIPWEGVTIVGTTDIDHDRDLWQEPVISSAEAEYIMEARVASFRTQSWASVTYARRGPACAEWSTAARRIRARSLASTCSFTKTACSRSRVASSRRSAPWRATRSSRSGFAARAIASSRRRARWSWPSHWA